MMETIELENLGGQTRQALEELTEVAFLKPGRILVVGCSSSEIDNLKIGSHSSAETGIAVYTVLYQELKPEGVYLAAQCREHLNRTLILEAEATRAYGHEPMSAVPQLKAEGSFTTAAHATLEHPVAVEHIRVHAGVDIGNTLIGMHVRDVAVPVRIKTKEMGSAYMVCVRIKLKFTGGVRARYDEENIQGPQSATNIEYKNGI